MTYSSGGTSQAREPGGLSWPRSRARAQKGPKAKEMPHLETVKARIPEISAGLGGGPGSREKD